MRVGSLLILVVGTTAGVVAGFLAASLPWASQHQPPVWLEVVQRVCTSVGGLGTLAALLYVVRQFNLLREQSDLVQRNVRASLDAQLYARLDSFNRFVVEHDAEYEMLDGPFGKAAEGHKARLHHLCDLGFTFYEQVFKHHVRYDLLDTEDWERWQQHMDHFFAKPYVRGYWQVVRPRYARSFQEFAQVLVVRTGTEGQATP